MRLFKMPGRMRYPLAGRVCAKLIDALAIVVFRNPAVAIYTLQRSAGLAWRLLLVAASARSLERVIGRERIFPCERLGLEIWLWIPGIELGCQLVQHLCSIVGRGLAISTV